MNTNAIYLRKSRSDSEDETIEETLDKHKRILFEFAKKAQLNISEIYFEVVSGDGLFVRPEMIRLLNDVEQGMYDGVLCMDIDRLGRVDTKDRGIILDTFKSSGTKIITPGKTYDLADETDEFSTEIQMLFARQELKKITKRLRIGLMRTVEDGYHVGEPPYGYRRVYIDKKPTLEIYEPEAKVIRMVYDMYVNQHYGSSTIAKTLNDMGLKPRKNDKFGRTTIQFYLSNPIYTGKIIFNKKHKIKKKLPTDKNRSVLNPQKDWIVADGVHQPIIEQQLFDEAQRIRSEHTHPPSFTGEIMNPLAGLVRCANCGSIMTRQKLRDLPPRLLCNTPACNRSIVCEKVEKRVLHMLKVALIDVESKKNDKNTNTEHISIITSAVNDIKKQLSVLQSQSDSLYDLLEQGVYDVNTFMKRSKLLSKKITELEKKLENYNTELSVIDVEPLRRKAIPLAWYLIENYEDMPASEKNIIFKILIKKITYKRDKACGNDFRITIDFNNWL